MNQLINIIVHRLHQAKKVLWLYTFPVPAGNLFTKRLLLLTATGISISCCAAAQHHKAAKDDKELVALFTGFKKADGYTYHISAESVLVGSTQKAPLKSSISYASLSDFIGYSRSDEGLIFLCDKGQFKVDNAQKTVWYKLFSNDTLLSSTRQSYLQQMSSVLDSIFLADASIVQQKKTKTTCSYRLAYPPTAAMKECNIIFRLSDGMPENIDYTVERTVHFSNPVVKMRQRLKMDHYQHSMPDEVRALLADSQDLYHYLQQKYQGYTFKKIEH